MCTCTFSVVAYLFYNNLIKWLILPYSNLDLPLSDILFVNALFEGFITKIRFSIYAGMVISFPIFIYQVMRFILPGLSKAERRVITICLLISFMLASASVYMMYFKLIPYSIQFLTGSQFIPDQIGVMLNFFQNVFLIFSLLVIACLVFQLPILMGALLYLNIFKRTVLWSAGRYIILIIFILAALITPPDIITQLSIALPMAVLYYVVLLIAKLFHWGE
jgi:sec-independent protein translocase protein TatC